MENLSIRSKLIMIIAITTLIAMAIGFSAVCVKSISMLKNSKLHESELIAKVVSDYSAGPLVFLDQEGAEEVLSRLSRTPDIEAGALYDREGNLFATYFSNKENMPELPNAEDLANLRQKPNGILDSFAIPEKIKISTPVDLDGQSQGTLYLQFSTDDLTQSILFYVGIVVLIAVSVFVIAFGLAFRLVKVVSDPISNLAKSARIISNEADYSLKLETTSKDEIGELYAAFNNMLEQIEARRLAQQQSIDDLDAAVTTLTASNEQLERFAYICSHDLQEPVRMVNSFSTLLEKHLKDTIDAKGAKYLGFITEGSANAKSLISDVLMFCRLDQAPQQYEDIALTELCNSVKTAISMTLEEKGCAFEWDDDLPVIRGVHSQCYQVLLNLVSNGLKFNQSEVPTVKVHCKDVGDNWKITVVDNGIGIDKEYQERVFEMFQRLNKRGQYPGTGMGLAICKKVIERNGATIELDSEEGKGCCFIIHWPKEGISKIIGNIKYR